MEDWEIKACLHGGVMAGEYMNEIGKTDLAQFTLEEWQTLLEIICLNYHAEHNRLKPCPF